MTAYQLNKSGTKVDQDLLEGLDNQPKENVAWDDLANSLIGRRLYSNSGSVDYDYSENAIVFSQNGDITDDNDCVIWNLQKPHAMSDNDTMNMHIHWEQTDNTTREFTLRYRIQSNGEAKTTAWTEVIVDTNTNNAFTYSSGTLNQITNLVHIDLSNATISATVQFRMTRSDSAGGIINTTFVDAHIPYDQLGSRQEYVK